jgi:hypothetical protein
MNFNRFRLLLILNILIIGFCNCKKTSEDGPSVPSENTMDMDFSYVYKQKPATIIGDTSNFQLARSLVTFWEDKTNEYMLIPKNAFKKALSSSPTKKYSGYWIRTVNFMIGSDEYLGELNSNDTTTVSNDSIEWSMLAAQVGSTEKHEFKYFAGKSAADNSGGWWKIYYPGDAAYSISKPFLLIQWVKTDGVLTSLKYTNIMTSDENKGAYIQFEQKNNNQPFDQSYNLKIISYPNNTSLNGKVIQIEWYNANNNGQIQINSSVWGCWDNHFINKADCAL